LNSAEENQFVLFLFQSINTTKGIWIGLVKDKKLQLFRWTSEERVGFKNWAEEPDINGLENCGEMVDYGSYRGKWNDIGCSSDLPFICEKKGKAQHFSHSTFSKLKTRLCGTAIVSYLSRHGSQEQICVISAIKEGKVELPI